MKHNRVIKLFYVLILTILLSLSVIPAEARAPEIVHHKELTFNPSGPILNNGKLNPFASKEIREAMNILIDRNYIKNNIVTQPVIPRWLPISSFGQDYQDLITEVTAIETKYAHNFADAEATIKQEMEIIGASKVGSDWYYNDEPVEILFIIRTEDERLAVGDYVADLLENIGFAVDRQYKTSSEASPIWYSSDPAEGLWHIYTGGWKSTGDEIEISNYNTFQFFYTPDNDVYVDSPLWAAYTPSTEFWELANEIAEDNYSNNDERLAAVSEALTLAMEDSVRIWLYEVPEYQIFMPLIIKP
jgi:peptide/nickel transport system substrate-binding protein